MRKNVASDDVYVQEPGARTRPRPTDAKPADVGVSRAWRALLPELGRFPPREQRRAFRVARETPLDFIELAAMAVALVAVTALTRYALADASLATRLVAAAANFAIALPMLVVAFGPFHLRRLRRGLRRQLAEQNPP